MSKGVTSRPDNRETLAAFLDGETAQVYARLPGDPDGPVVFLPEEGKAAFVAKHGDRFACIIPGCDLDLGVVGGAHRRHHFRHESEPGRGHGVESVMHQQAKALIHQWALDQGATAKVEKVLEGGSRRPDVFIEALPDPMLGSVAVEVQYSPLAIESTGTSFGFAERHGWYTARRIPGVWLLGHLGAQMRLTWGGNPPAGVEVRVELSDLHRQIAAAGMPVLWINPIEATVGTGVIVGDNPDRLTDDWRDPWWERLDTVGERLPDGGDLTAHMRIDPLADCRLDPRLGLITPTMKRIAEHRALLAARAARARAAAERMRRAHEQREAARLAAARTAAARAPAEKEAARAKAIEIKAQRAAAWPAHPARAAMLEACGGTVPGFIATELRGDDNIRAYHEHWHWVVYRDLVHGRVGATHTGKAFWASVRGSFATNPNVRWVNKAVLDYMDRLRHAGLVDFTADWNGFVATVTVLADIRSGTRTAAPSTPGTPRPTTTPLAAPAWKRAVDACLLDAAVGSELAVRDLMDRTGVALLGTQFGDLLDHLRRHEAEGRLRPREDADGRTVWVVQRHAQPGSAERPF